MKRSINTVVLSTILGLASANAFAQQQTNPTTDYDFRYVSNGQQSLTPIQVFDNGVNTFIQLHDDKDAPAIFAAGQSGRKLLLSHKEGQYLVVSGLYAHLIIQKNSNQMADVYYSGPGRTAVFSNGSTSADRKYSELRVQQATKVRYTAAPPLAGDQTVEQSLSAHQINLVLPKNSTTVAGENRRKIEQFAKKYKDSNKVSIAFVEAQNERSGVGLKRAYAVRSLLVKEGIDPSIVTVREAAEQDQNVPSMTVTVAKVSAAPSSPEDNGQAVGSNEPANYAKGEPTYPDAPVAAAKPEATPAVMPVVAPAAAPTPSLHTYQFKQSDGSLRGSINRWAEDEGYHLAWEASRNFPVPPDSSFQANSIREALSLAMKATLDTDYPCRAIIVEGSKVIRVIHNDQTSTN